LEFSGNFPGIYTANYLSLTKINNFLFYWQLAKSYFFVGNTYKNKNPIMNDGQNYEQLADRPLDTRLSVSEKKSGSEDAPSHFGEDGTFAPGYESFASTNFKKKRSLLYKFCTPLKKGTPTTPNP
jgi:hypothetical protein